MIEQVGTTYRAQLDASRIITIGDEHDRAFRPYVSLSAFGGESIFGIGLPTMQHRQPVFDGRSVTWTDGDTLARFYLLGKGVGREHGGLEWELVLGSRPRTDRFPMRLDLHGVTLDYQPRLTEADLRRGVRRPEAIVGSFAAYHKTRTAWHASSQDAAYYQTGKAFHLLRPEVTDATGAHYWLEWTRDGDGNPDGVYLDPALFAVLAYPVTIGPTFGYTSIGASYDTAPALFAQLDALSPAGTNTLTNISMAIGDNGAGAYTVKFGWYTESGGAPNTRVAVDATAWSGPTGAASFATNPVAMSYALSASTQYWAGCSLETGVDRQWMFDTGGSKTFKWRSTSGLNDPATTDGDITTTAHVSVYGTYTAGGGGGGDLSALIGEPQSGSSDLR